MPTVTYELIREAILTKRIIRATFEGSVRWFCPHVIGLTDGRPHVLVYQFKGFSKAGLGPAGSEHNWRCFFVKDLTRVSIEDGPWYTADNHSTRQTCVEKVDVEITY